MNSDRKAGNNWQGLIPRSRSAIVSLVIVAVVAFSLGGLMLDGGESMPSSESFSEDARASSTASSEPTSWTCSMHPQIHLPKPGKCPICFMDLIPVETGGGGADLNPNQIRMSETAVQLAGIQTTPVVRAYAERSVRMVGKLDYDETTVSYITAWVPGRLDSLFADYTGATVTKGDHMVYLYSPELISAQEELLQAKKAIAALSRTASKVLKSTADETLRSAREKLRLYGLSDKLIADIEESNAPRDHLTITAPAGGVVVHKDAKEGMYVSVGTRIYTIADLTRLWVLLEAYESDLPWLRYGQPITFTSPSFPGESFEAVTSFIDPVVNPQTRTVNIRAVVKNKDMRLKPEMFVSATVLSRLDSEGRVIAPELAGKWISPMHPEIVRDAPGKCDICGMDLVPAETFGYTAVQRSSGEAPLLIPTSAPLITGTRAVVYLQMPSDEEVVFEGREVTLGPRAGDYYVVKQGLSEGDKVVTNGAFKIDSELQIQAKPSMMSPQGGAAAAGHQHGAGSATSMNESDMKKSEGMPAYVAGSAKRLDGQEEARVALIPVYEAYFKVQMALANDDLAEAQNAYTALHEAVSRVNMTLLRDEAHPRWMKIAQALTSATDAGKSAGSIAAARDAFFHASLAAIELHDTFGHAADAPYFLTFCPMARDNAGAYWLQEDNIVWNSFYGEAMLRCGEIKQELQAGDAPAE
jgi:Cu(I)/Ag(I) efflux system membrane fusion protein